MKIIRVERCADCPHFRDETCWEMDWGVTGQNIPSWCPLADDPVPELLAACEAAVAWGMIGVGGSLTGYHAWRRVMAQLKAAINMVKRREGDGLS